MRCFGGVEYKCQSGVKCNTKVAYCGVGLDGEAVDFHFEFIQFLDERVGAHEFCRHLVFKSFHLTEIVNNTGGLQSGGVLCGCRCMSA